MSECEICDDLIRNRYTGKRAECGAMTPTEPIHDLPNCTKPVWCPRPMRVKV